MSANAKVPASPEDDRIRSTMSVGNLISTTQLPLLQVPAAVPPSPESVSDGVIKDSCSTDGFVSPAPADNTPQPSAAPQDQDDTGDTGASINDAGTAAGGSSSDNAAATDTKTTTTQVTREFVCMNDEYSECQTGQVTLNLSRKVISNHFGRNKGCTRLITDWPLFCRKHYQRATYKPDLWQRRKIHLIARQIDRIEVLHPGTTYDITLKKSEEKRLNDFARKVSGGMSVDEASAAVAPDEDLKAFQAPIDVLRHLEHYLGTNKEKEEVKEVVALILDMLKKDETKEVPSIEFLPFFPGSRKVKAVKTAKPHPQRVSGKGGVKKPTKD